MPTISTHVLDTARGIPAAGIDVTLEREIGDDSWSVTGHGTTNDDGRVADIAGADGAVEPGTYRMCFATGPYLARTAGGGFYPRARIEFTVETDMEHYHVPLLLSPWGYSTYRGS
jgi:5-hydroxyisourate hydrolase